MRHDKEAGLIHLTEEELKLLKEPRTPIDDRAAPLLLDKTVKLHQAVIDGIATEYGYVPSVVARNAAHIEELRSEEARRAEIKNAMADIALDVEIRHQLSA